MVLVSSLANPAIILHYCKQKIISATLFIGFSLSASINNALRGSIAILNLLKPAPSVKHTEPHALLQAATVTHNSMYWYSINFIMIVSVTRLISVKYPFYQMSRQYIYCYIFLYTVSVPTLFTVIQAQVVAGKAVFLPRITGTISGFFKGYFCILYCLVCSLAVSYIVSFIVSLIALFTLSKKSKAEKEGLARSEKKKQGVRALATINVLNGIFIVSSVLGIAAFSYYSMMDKYTEFLTFINAGIIPCFLCAINPVVLLIFGSDLRRQIKSAIVSQTSRIYTHNRSYKEN